MCGCVCVCVCLLDYSFSTTLSPEVGPKRDILKAKNSSLKDCLFVTNAKCFLLGVIGEV